MEKEKGARCKGAPRLYDDDEESTEARRGGALLNYSFPSPSALPKAPHFFLSLSTSHPLTIRKTSVILHLPLKPHHHHNLPLPLPRTLHNHFI